MRVLGLDIGGANIKYALATKRSILPMPRKIPFELFRDPHKLDPILKKIVSKSMPDAIALTMTGELSDVFASRKEGVAFIIDSLLSVARKVPVKVLGVNGAFISPSMAKQEWQRVASANWMATARWVADRTDNLLVVDIGSTTTDIIPIRNGKVAAIGKIDFDRLKAGELIYKGYLRTNCAMVCPEICLDGVMVASCPEYFSIVADAHLYLGDITAREYTCQTPDDGPKTKRGAAKRLARLILSDPVTLGQRGVKNVARQISDMVSKSIANAIEGYIKQHKMGAVPILLIGPEKFYRPRLTKIVNSWVISEVAGATATRIDPASCIAGLIISGGK